MTMLRKSRKPFTAPKPRKQSRVGKTGTVRLVGPDMSKLREQAYLRANGMCELKIVCSGGYVPWKSGQLVHKRTKRNHGDTLDNVLWGCGGCHLASHNCDGKPIKVRKPALHSNGEHDGRN